MVPYLFMVVMLAAGLWWWWNRRWGNPEGNNLAGSGMRGIAGTREFDPAQVAAQDHQFYAERSAMGADKLNYDGSIQHLTLPTPDPAMTAGDLARSDPALQF